MTGVKIVHLPPMQLCCFNIALYGASYYLFVERVITYLSLNKNLT